MTKATKLKTIIILIGLCFSFLLMALFSSVSVASAGATENNVLESRLDSAGIEILDGASVSTAEEYTISWRIKIPGADLDKIDQANETARLSKYEDYFLKGATSGKTRASLILFDETKIPTLSAGLPNVDVIILFGVPMLYHNDEMLTPAYKIDIDLEERPENEIYRAKQYVGKNNVYKSYVPVLVTWTSYHTEGWLGSTPYDYRHERLDFNVNTTRSVQLVSQRTLDDYDAGELELDEWALSVLQANVGATYTPPELEETEEITNLESAYPLDFEMISGASLNDDQDRIVWKCSFNLANFNEWATKASNVSLTWMLLKFSDYIATDNPKSDFEINCAAAQEIKTEQTFSAENDLYVSTFSYQPTADNEMTAYIAIPFIKVIGLKANTTADGVSFSGVTSGTYVLCEMKDNGISLYTLKGGTGKFTYTFAWLEELENKPFAIEKTQTVTLDERLDYDSMQMRDFAELLDIEIDDNGNIGCLMSKILQWTIDQPTIDTFSVYATYSLIPLTFTNDKGQVKVQNLGLVPFTKIETNNEYATLLTSLRDREGVPFFESEYSVEKSKLYGYFYTYSYESEYKDPNWTLNEDKYNGYISYFTSLERQEYKVGYMELAGYGSLAGITAGAVIGTIIAPGVGSLVGAVVGGVACGSATALVGSLFGCEQDSTTVYYNIEYGFLDCTTMTPGGYYDTEEEPDGTFDDLSEFEKIAMILIIAIELILIVGALGKFKVLGPIPCFIFILILIGLFIWADITIFNFFILG